MEHGGIYLDTDVRMVKPYNPLLQFGMFCGFESKSRVNLGQGFGARKGHPVIRKMRDQYRELSFINPDGSINIVVQRASVNAYEEMQFVLQPEQQEQS